MPIRNKIIILITLAVLLPLAGTGTYLYLSQSAYLQNNLGTVLASIGRATAQTMDRFIVQRGPELELVSGSSTLRRTPESARYGMSRYLETFTDFDAFVFVDPSGELIAQQGTVLLSKGEQRLEDTIKRWYASAVNGDRLIDVIAEPGPFDRYLVYIAPVRHEHVDYGWLFGQVDSERIAATSIAVEVGNTGRATLFNEDGLLIGHEDKSRYGNDMSGYSIMQAPLNHNQGHPGDTFVSADGREKWGMTLLFEESLEKYGLRWGLIVDQTTAEMYAPIHQIRNSILASILISLVIFVPIGGFLAVRQISNPIQRMVSHLEMIARSDFTTKVTRKDLDRKDEIGTAAHAIRTLIENIASVVSRISGNTNILSTSAVDLSSVSQQTVQNVRTLSERTSSVAAAAEETSANTDSVADGMGQATQSLSSVAGAAEEMSVTVGEIAGNTERARRISDEAVQQAQRVAGTMQSLGTAAQEIDRVTETITEISSQTNLLALNATIEAARAGAAGKGFAVVANEIKELACQATAATEDIKRRISGIQTSTGSAVTDIDQINQVVREVGELVSSIAVATEEQATVTRALAGNIAHVSDGVQDANRRVIQTAEVSREMARDIAEVNTAATDIRSGAKQVQASAADLSNLADQLKALLEQFRVA